MRVASYKTGNGKLITESYGHKFVLSMRKRLLNWITKYLDIRDGNSRGDQTINDKHKSSSGFDQVSGYQGKDKYPVTSLTSSRDPRSKINRLLNVDVHQLATPTEVVIYADNETHAIWPPSWGCTSTRKTTRCVGKNKNFQDHWRGDTVFSVIFFSI